MLVSLSSKLKGVYFFWHNGAIITLIKNRVIMRDPLRGSLENLLGLSPPPTPCVATTLQLYLNDNHTVFSTTVLNMNFYIVWHHLKCYLFVIWF